MPKHWHRLLVAASICGIAPASAWSAPARAAHRNSSACPYQRAREAALVSAYGSIAEFSVFKLSQDSSPLVP